MTRGKANPKPNAAAPAVGKDRAHAAAPVTAANVAIWDFTGAPEQSGDSESVRAERIAEELAQADRHVIRQSWDSGSPHVKRTREELKAKVIELEKGVGAWQAAKRTSDEPVRPQVTALVDDLFAVLSKNTGASPVRALPGALRISLTWVCEGLDFMMETIASSEDAEFTEDLLTALHQVVGSVMFQLEKYGYSASRSFRRVIAVYALRRYNITMSEVYSSIRNLAVSLGVGERDRAAFRRHVLQFFEAGGAVSPKMAEAARENTGRAKAKPRPKWENRKGDDLNLSPPEFIAKHYAAEMAAGTLHRGVIAQDDKPLAVKLANWLRTHAMPEGIDIPTLPEWNTRQLAKLEGGEAELLRLYGVARRRKDRLTAPAVA